MQDTDINDREPTTEENVHAIVFCVFVLALAGFCLASMLGAAMG